MKLFTSLMILSFLMLGACGKQAGDNNTAQAANEKTVQQKEAMFGPLVGRYEGLLVDEKTKEEQPIVLVLIKTFKTTQNPGQNDLTEVPTLGGNINIVISSSNAQDVIPVAQFTSAYFDPNSGQLVLSGNINSGTSIGNILNTLDAKVNGNRIVGQLYNSTRGMLGTVSVTKSFSTEQK